MPQLRRPRPLTSARDETRAGTHAAAVMELLGVPDMPTTHGNCYGKDPDMWFADTRRHSAIATAKAACASCPIRRECLAMGEHEAGIWGGTTEAERAHMSAAA
jgi:WhiB family redox-sensing transcriptional regulator